MVLRSRAPATQTLPRAPAVQRQLAPARGAQLQPPERHQKILRSQWQRDTHASTPQPGGRAVRVAMPLCAQRQAVGKTRRAHGKRCAETRRSLSTVGDNHTPRSSNSHSGVIAEADGVALAVTTRIAPQHKANRVACVMRMPQHPNRVEAWTRGGRGLASARAAAGRG